jgi:hypothetical protein
VPGTARAVADDDAGLLAERYFAAWTSRDWPAMASLLAADVAFRGPLANLDGADACIAGLQRMSEIMTGVVVRKRFVDGPDVLTWFDLHTTVAAPAPTANWSHIANGRIASIQVTFDARGLGPPP